MTRRTRMGVERELEVAAQGAWAVAAASHERNHQLRPGVSALLGCARAAWFGLHGTPPTEEPAPGRQAQIGTWIHAGLLPALRRAYGGEIEVPVTLRFDVGDTAVEIPGSADLVSPPVLVDVKTVGANAVQSYLRNGPKLGHLAQVWGYATALNAEAPESVEWCVLLYVERDSGETFTHVVPYAALDERIRPDVLEWAAEVADEAVRPPAGERGPGLSIVCDGCKWLRACWGPDATPGQTGAQAVLADEGGAVDAMRLYESASAQVKAAEADKKFALAILSRTPPGRYEGYALSHQSGGMRLDQARAVELLEMHGIHVPRNEARGSMRVRRTKS